MAKISDRAIIECVSGLQRRGWIENMTPILLLSVELTDIIQRHNLFI